MMNRLSVFDSVFVLVAGAIGLCGCSDDKPPGPKGQAGAGGEANGDTGGTGGLSRTGGAGGVTETGGRSGDSGGVAGVGDAGGAGADVAVLAGSSAGGAGGAAGAAATGGGPPGGRGGSDPGGAPAGGALIGGAPPGGEAGRDSGGAAGNPPVVELCSTEGASECSDLRARRVCTEGYWQEEDCPDFHACVRGVCYAGCPGYSFASTETAVCYMPIDPDPETGQTTVNVSTAPALFPTSSNPGAAFDSGAGFVPVVEVAGEALPLAWRFESPDAAGGVLYSITNPGAYFDAMGQPANVYMVVYGRALPSASTNDVVGIFSAHDDQGRQIDLQGWLFPTSDFGWWFAPLDATALPLLNYDGGENSVQTAFFGDIDMPNVPHHPVDVLWFAVVYSSL